MPREIEVRCPPATGRRLVEALRGYVASRYPYAADECSAAAREALLDLADRFERDLVGTGVCIYSQRIRAFVSEAVRYHCEVLEAREGKPYRARCELYVGIVRGTPADRQDEAAAERADLG